MRCVNIQSRATDIKRVWFGTYQTNAAFKQLQPQSAQNTAIKQLHTTKNTEHIYQTEPDGIPGDFWNYVPMK